MMKMEELYSEFLASGGVSTDSRKLQENEVFFALQGVHFDANAFVPDALEKGCRLVVAGDRRWLGTPRVMVVESPLLALQELARHHRRERDPRVLAITGSNGKTTTKELIARVLSVRYNILVTKGNLNNHIGVPLTLLGLKGEEIAVIEMGANHLEEIARLCEIAEPDLGLITNIGKAHLEGFGSLEGVRQGKGELFDYLAAHGKPAFLDTGDPVLTDMAAERGLQTIPYSVGSDGAVAGMPDESGFFAGGTLSVEGRQFNIRSSLTGSYNFRNIMAAVAVGTHFGVETDSLLTAVESYSPDNNRSQLLEGKTTRIVLDAYNANPTSMRASLENFLAFGSRPRMVVLGDMLELGSSSGDEHLQLLDWLAGENIDRVWLVGKEFCSLGSGYPDFRFFADIDRCVDALESDRPEGFHILLKGSRKIAVEKATKILLDC